jgi:hypothetical protein
MFKKMKLLKIFALSFCVLVFFENCSQDEGNKLEESKQNEVIDLNSKVIESGIYDVNNDLNNPNRELIRSGTIECTGNCSDSDKACQFRQSMSISSIF